VAKNSIWDIPKKFVLYRDEGTPALMPEEVADYLQNTIGIQVTVKGGFLKTHWRGRREALARMIAAARVRNLAAPFAAEEPMYGEVMFEQRFLEEPERKVPGVLYDGGRFRRLLLNMLPPDERSFELQHVAFTSRLIGTFESDGRYHAHVNICGYPSIISTSGVVEAPAKPKEYYVLKQRFVETGQAVPFELLKERFSGRFIDYDDPRLTEVLKGYALQCAVYAIAKEPFCKNQRCRLFDAHWQSELIRAQLSGDRFCKRHSGMLKSIREAASASAVRSRC
jgi:hypothetical protein